jgi:hypothetical protein
MRKSLTLTFALAVIAPTSALATRYQIVDSNDKSILFANLDTIDRSGNYVKVWTTMIFATPQASKIDLVKIYARYDCAEKRSMTLSGIGYDSDMNLTKNYSLSGVWNYVVPDSFGDSMMKFVCNPNPKIDPIDKADDQLLKNYRAAFAKGMFTNGIPPKP